MRFTNTVPQQALFMMNSPFVVQQARALAAKGAELAPEQRVRMLYQTAFSRNPTESEVKLGVQFVQSDAATPVLATSGPAWRYGDGRDDEASQRVKEFTPLPHFTGHSWQGGKTLPDPKLVYCLLNPQGGHVGHDPAHAVIRRWIAPRDGVVTITGKLAHGSANGDGVRGRIVSSRTGELVSLTVHNKSAQTQLDEVEVKRGDTVDFIVDCRASDAFDSFTWPVSLKMKNIPDSVAGGQDTQEWDSQKDFAGPDTKPRAAPLTPWEKYAQILLETNEFVFVD
jgi:hypothetical protein